MPQPIRIIYVAGCGRSGSTLIDNILGQVDGCFSCGELWHIWRRGLIENRVCSDGIAFLSHPFWQAVFERGFGGMDAQTVGLDRILEEEARALRVGTRYPCLAAGRTLHIGSGIARYMDALHRLYRALAETSRATFLVDSSKYPVYAFHLARLPGVSLHVLHLVRDPRAVAHSWLRTREQPDKGAMMDRHGTLWSTLQWRMANAAAESLPGSCGLRCMRMRYEDFIAAPRRSVDELLRWLGIAGGRTPFNDEVTVETRPNHAFSGNPSRFRSGAVPLSIDDEWRRSMPAWRRRVIETLAGDALSRYGYA